VCRPQRVMPIPMLSNRAQQCRDIKRHQLQVYVRFRRNFGSRLTSVRPQEASQYSYTPR